MLPNSLNMALGCNDNQLTALPPLPSQLDQLYCSGNAISMLPQLPDSLRVLHSTNNQLNCLPQLPGKITSLRVSGNSITCLPNFPATLVLNATQIGFSPIVACASNDPCFIATNVAETPFFQKEIHISPNPSTGLVNLLSDSPILETSVHDLNGKRAISVQGGNLRQQIDLSSLDQGMYLVKVTTESGILTQRVMIQR